MNVTSRLEDQATQDVKRILQEFIDSWNQKDLGRFGNLFTENAEFTDVIGQTAIGKEAIIKQHIFPFEKVMKFATLEMNDAYIRDLTPDLIIVSAFWRVTGSVTPDGKELPIRNGVLQIIIARETDGLLLRLVHNSDNALPYEKQEKFIR